MINSFKVRTGHPMVDSLESAKAFLEQCKNPFQIRIKGTKEKYEFQNKYVKKSVKNIVLEYGNYIVVHLEDIDEWTEYQIEQYTEQEAIKACYKLRKYINARFRN